MFQLFFFRTWESILTFPFDKCSQTKKTKKLVLEPNLSLAYSIFDEWATLRTAAALHAKKAEYLGKEADAENRLESVNALRKCRLVQIYLSQNQFHKTKLKFQTIKELRLWSLKEVKIIQKSYNGTTG